MPSQMHSALCPHCGAAMYSTVGGSQLVLCSGCQWTGRVAFYFLPNSGGFASVGGMAGGANMQVLTSPTPDDALAPDPLAARREMLHQELSRLTSDVADLLSATPDGWWALDLWQYYEQLQERHGRLFDALGRRRMGAYRPDSGRMHEALMELLLWALLVFDGATR